MINVTECDGIVLSMSGARDAMETTLSIPLHEGAVVTYDGFEFAVSIDARIDHVILTAIDG